jgi:hypothetical protein
MYSILLDFTDNSNGSRLLEDAKCFDELFRHALCHINPAKKLSFKNMKNKKIIVDTVCRVMTRRPCI